MLRDPAQQVAASNSSGRVLPQRKDAVLEPKTFDRPSSLRSDGRIENNDSTAWSHRSVCVSESGSSCVVRVSIHNAIARMPPPPVHECASENACAADVSKENAIAFRLHRVAGVSFSQS
jgi:hypothetical protein